MVAFDGGVEGVWDFERVLVGCYFWLSSTWKSFSSDKAGMKSLLPLSTLFEQGSSKLSSTSKQLARVFQELPKAEAESSTAPVTVLKSSVWMLLKLPQRPCVDEQEDESKTREETAGWVGKGTASTPKLLTPKWTLPEREPFPFRDFLMLPQTRQDLVFRV